MQLRGRVEQYCENGATFTYNSIDKDGTATEGGYSQAFVVNENFVLRIPDSLELDGAAPLLCAGITLFSPLRHWKAGPDKRLAVIGLGGLGHMGVKLAPRSAPRYGVSQSLKKMEDGLRLGAKQYYATADPETFKKLRNRFDLIINTVSANLTSASTCAARRRRHAGEVGTPEHPMKVSAFPLSPPRRSLSGSYRRYRRDPGDAGFLRRARHAARNRDHPGRPDQ